ncbi:MAG: bifunctional glutamate N-acetyltransferase/amino-acid acetyltransferase ArgJ [Melioribacteraceae bacterium]
MENSNTQTIEKQFSYIENGSITSPIGISASGIHCGLKKKKKDLALIVSKEFAEVAGTFTTNKAQAAPVIIDKKIIDSGTKVKAMIINSAYANACTGDEGFIDALEIQEKTAHTLSILPSELLISSTGLIGERIPVSKVTSSLNELVYKLADDGGIDAANAIMTTDLMPKHFGLTVQLSKGAVTIGGIAKGSGMIHPNMATMLGFVTTDAKFSKSLLQTTLTNTVNNSFNKISVDGETSTNDMVLLMANGMSNVEITEDTNDYQIFSEALQDLTQSMAKSIVADGEGATKFITINIKNAQTEKDANKIAEAIAISPLVKTAMNGNDPNWGRIISAASSSGAEIVPEKLSLYFGDLQILQPGYKSVFTEEEAVNVLKEKEIIITLDLLDGTANTTWWTCDYSEQYIKINSQYRT